MSPRLHQLLERISSLFQASLRQTASAHGLKLVQLEALVYLSMANRYSDTPLSLAEYLGITKGTVSQTLKALERGGYVDKVRDEEDGRVVHCHLTESGRAVVREAYPTPLLELLPSTAAGDAVPVLEDLLRSLQLTGGLRTFGICHTCRHFQPKSRGGRCGLTQEHLSRGDVNRICREHAAEPVPK